ncbi:hypothetical protein ISN45_Aa01g025440 [Arabidopsis thaliana x Arabidopsis arenosa]|uniref:Uncharacterized protein n=1 Tax=Arabidopsis thaliana x Arabidopsis arenosa TaxID=1240361 RepID=A0A8T2C676_9BRAS|nr:hypothetical protein ISN45_Aa01g025440 [Arabidopsis thaliana x Arabidopsis arenosa]
MRWISISDLRVRGRSKEERKRERRREGMKGETYIEDLKALVCAAPKGDEGGFEEEEAPNRDDAVTVD